MEELQSLARKLYSLFVIMFLLIGAIFVWLYTYEPKKTNNPENLIVKETEEWQPKDALTELGNMPSQVKKGYYLITETSKYMGPAAHNSKDRYSGNNLACANCHLKAGAQAGSGSWVGVVERFPQFRGRENQIGTIQERINGCMERSMNGKKLPLDSDKMKSIVAYMDWLSEGIPEYKKKEFKGYPKITIPAVAVNMEKGKQVFVKECVVCHGTNGQGLKKPDNIGYTYPPLWGPDSYNDGAGMTRVITAAQFIKSNMPYLQATWDNPKLTDEEAFHVAGYINSFSRPQKANKKKDFPDKKLKPVSTPYGPWEDDFSAEQHKYGPFPPMIAFYKKQYDIIKTK